jgi:hypothetical protein
MSRFFVIFRETWPPVTAPYPAPILPRSCPAAGGGPRPPPRSRPARRLDPPPRGKGESRAAPRDRTIHRRSRNDVPHIFPQPIPHRRRLLEPPRFHPPRVPVNSGQDEYGRRSRPPKMTVDTNLAPGPFTGSGRQRRPASPPPRRYTTDRCCGGPSVPSRWPFHPARTGRSPFTPAGVRSRTVPPSAREARRRCRTRRCSGPAAPPRRPWHGRSPARTPSCSRPGWS